jgi:competence protein ComEA
MLSMNKLSKVLLIVCLSFTAFYTSATSSDEAKQNEQAESVITATKMVNINKANETTFATLKGIGLKKAQAIVLYRTTHGEFKNLDDLLKVKGIGQHVINQNKARLAI